eukprot:maker-scaffold_9-snap-gene-9.3-mRNA-1 protein AED:0.05 eAED:0.05 QI:53/1/1/1/0.5/0.33/3/112/134
MSSLLRHFSSLTFSRKKSSTIESPKIVELEGQEVVSCSKCLTHLTYNEELCSKHFFGHAGTAYLYNTCVNIALGKVLTRNLYTGEHKVCDVFCLCCDQYLGWKYEDAKHQAQKYKIGKFILEKKHFLIQDTYTE